MQSLEVVLAISQCQYENDTPSSTCPSNAMCMVLFKFLICSIIHDIVFLGKMSHFVDLIVLLNLSLKEFFVCASNKFHPKRGKNIVIHNLTSITTQNNEMIIRQYCQLLQFILG
jgi:hypothetical protein